VEWKRVLDVADPDPLAFDQDPHDVEPIGVRNPAMTGNPDAGGASQLLLLPPVDGFDRTAEPIAASSLHLHERDHSIPLDHEIDVAMPGPEAALDHSPPTPPEPSLRDPLPQLAE
jgi:hypothetical protein